MKVSVSAILRSHTARSAAVYSAASAISALLSLATIPLLTRHLDAAQYARAALFLTAVSAILPLVLLNGHGWLVTHSIREGATDPGRLSALIRTTLLSTLVLLASLSAMASIVPHSSGLSPQFISLAILTGSAQAIICIHQALTQGEGLHWQYCRTALGGPLLTFATTVWLVVICGTGLPGRIASISITALAFALLILLAWHKRWRKAFSPPQQSRYREILAYGLPMMPHVLAGWFIVAGDRFIVAGQLGLADASKFIIAGQFAMVMGFLSDGIGQAWAPWCQRMLNEGNPDRERLIVKLTWLSIPLSTLVAGLFTLFAPPIIHHLLGDRWTPSASCLGLLSAGYAFNLTYRQVGIILAFHERTGLLSSLTITSCVVQLAVLSIALPAWGVNGAALAQCAGQFTLMTLTWIAAAYIHPLPWITWIQRSQPPTN